MATAEALPQRQHDVIMSLGSVERPATAGTIAGHGDHGDARGVAQTLRATERAGYTERRENGYMLTRRGAAYVRRYSAPGPAAE